MKYEVEFGERTAAARNALNSSRPLVFENASPEYPYSVWGTCFLCEAGGKIFALAAGHSLRGREPHHIRILADVERRDLVQVAWFGSASSSDANDPDRADLVVMALEDGAADYLRETRCPVLSLKMASAEARTILDQIVQSCM